MSKIKIVDFSKFPGGRYIKYGPDSGELFRDEWLIPAINKLEKGETLEIDLSVVYTYAPSFLDEAFAQIIRRKILSYEEFKEKIKFTADLPNDFFIEMIDTFLKEARDSVLADADDN